MSRNKIALLCLIPILMIASFSSCNTTEPTVKADPIKGKTVEAIVQSMSLAEKVGQMTQADRAYLIRDADIKNYFLGSLLSGGGSTPEVNAAAAWADMIDDYQSLASQTRLGIP
ncbi:beta-glucosidase, partial [bacterium]|nr:beta-glucosidase [bacterium]